MPCQFPLARPSSSSAVLFPEPPPAPFRRRHRNCRTTNSPCLRQTLRRVAPHGPGRAGSRGTALVRDAQGSSTARPAGLCSMLLSTSADACSHHGFSCSCFLKTVCDVMAEHKLRAGTRPQSSSEPLSAQLYSEIVIILYQARYFSAPRGRVTQRTRAGPSQTVPGQHFYEILGL